MTAVDNWWRILHGSHGSHRLSYSECLALLELGHVGHLGFTTPAGPQIVPTGYVCLGDQVFLPAGLHGRLGGQIDHQRVSFEVDQLHLAPGRGWGGWIVRTTGIARLARADGFWIDLADALERAHAARPPMARRPQQTLTCIDIDTIVGDQLDNIPTYQRGGTLVDTAGSR